MNIHPSTITTLPHIGEPAKFVTLPHIEVISKADWNNLTEEVKAEFLKALSEVIDQ